MRFEWIALIVPILLSIGALAFRNPKKWPAFKNVLSWSFLAIFASLGATGVGLWLAYLFPDNTGHILKIVAFGAGGAGLALLLLELVHWLRQE